MELKKVLVFNYMPYAKSTIISRAIPFIDGLKPVNRRILYTMHKMGLYDKKSKSANIVGQCMKFHPHGDMAIYETLVRMTTGNEALNAPYIESKGTFGKVYSSTTGFAAPRYTEAKLAAIAKELFDGIDENAVDFKDNYDSTDREPKLLPVKFPTILINTSSGIAVGRASSIPSFGLTPVCKATIGVLQGTITTVEELMEVLGAPEFTTGGYIHGSKAEYNNLGRTGRGSITVSGTVETYPDRIIITEIPYRTTIEAILDEVEALVKTGDLKEVSDIRDESDIKGLRAVIELKRGSNVGAVLRKINRYTKLRMQMSFNTWVVVERNGKQRCLSFGLLDLLEEWIKFRIDTIQRIYQFRLNKKKDHAHLLEAWEKIKDDIKEVARFAADNVESVVISYLKSKYGMDDTQANYIADMRFRDITKDRLAKRLVELESIRRDIVAFTNITNSEEEKKKIIVSELTTIIDKYGSDRKTVMAEPIVEDTNSTAPEEQIEDVQVSVLITNRGYAKRLITLRDEANFTLHDDDKIRWRFLCSNRDDILVFTYSGMCYKIPVHTIDASKGVPKDYIFNLVEKIDDSEILCVTPSNNYKGSINIVYDSGRGVKVRFSKVSGNRSRYKSLFEEGTPKTLWCTAEDKFFMITRKRKAAYIDLALVNKMGTRSAFKVARVGDDEIFDLQPLSKVPNAKQIDFSRYSKGYCVKINEDKLW